MTKTEQDIEKIILPVIQKLGYELYDVEFVKESTNWFLRVYIEKENHTIDLDDCEKVSDTIGEELDRVDPISMAYTLEVSSCGLERHLREPKHFKWAIGKNISVKLYKPVDSKKQVEGLLESFEDDKLSIKTDSNEKLEIKLQDIANAKLLYDWEE